MYRRKPVRAELPVFEGAFQLTEMDVVAEAANVGGDG